MSNKSVKIYSIKLCVKQPDCVYLFKAIGIIDTPFYVPAQNRRYKKHVYIFTFEVVMHFEAVSLSYALLLRFIYMACVA